MELRLFTLISINKKTKQRITALCEETEKVMNDLTFTDECNYYVKINAFKNYYMIYNDDINTHCLSIFKKIEGLEELKQLTNYTQRLISEVDEELRLLEEEQERLRQEEEKVFEINEEDIVEIE